MDLTKIGKFIKDCRKQKGFTQIQLAEKLMVSEKTISKWECGNGFPDTTLMLPLCEALGITANELLSGKFLKTDSEYREDAENNILKLKKEQERSAKFLLNLEIVIGVLSVLFLLGCTFVSAIEGMPGYLRIITIVVGFVVSLPCMHLCIVIEKEAGYYECQHCNHKYIPTFRQIYFSTHLGRTRHMKCPKCNKKSWQRKVITKD